MEEAEGSDPSELNDFEEMSRLRKIRMIPAKNGFPSQRDGTKINDLILALKNK